MLAYAGVVTMAVFAIIVSTKPSEVQAANVSPQTGMTQTYSAFTPTGYATITASTTTSNVALGSTGVANQAFIAWVQNLNTVGVNVQLGTDNTVTASTTSGLYLPPGACAPMNAISGSYPATYLAAVTASGTAQINVITGYGLPSGACPGGSSASGGSTGAPVNGTAATGGAAPLSRLVSSAATTNATTAKASPGRVYRVFGCNTTTTPVYLKFYNIATTPVPGTTTVFLSRPFPAAATAGALSCQSFDVSDIGWYFSAGIGYALTTGNVDSDATAPAAGAIVQLSVDGL